jgi:purine catabolism regulator
MSVWQVSEGPPIESEGMSDDPIPEPVPGDLTVRALLSLPTFDGAEVAVGREGLDRLVRHVTVVAGTEIARWVKPSALVVASGHLVQGMDRPTVCGLIDALDERGAACLAMRLGAYADDVPEEILATARARGFPIILLKDTYAFDDIVIDVMSRVNDRLATDLVLADNVHASLAELLIRGGQFQDITREVGRLLHAEVTYVDLASQTELDAVEDGRVVPSLDSGPQTNRRSSMSNSRLVIRVGGLARALGWLVCERAGARFNSAEVRALERAATVVALALTQRAAVREVEMGYRGDTLGRLLRGEVAHRDVEGVFRDLGWFAEPPFTVVVISAVSPDRDRRGTLARWLRSFAVDSLERRLSSRVAVAVIDLDVVLVAAAADKASVLDAALGVVAAARLQAAATGGDPPGIGVGAPVDDASELPRAFKEARVAATHALSGRSGPVVEYAELGAIGLVLMAAGERGIGDMADTVLAPVLRLPERDSRELLRTISALMTTNLRQTEAARLIPCHYNTLRHRIARLESLVGPFTRDSDAWVNICMAMRAREGARSDDAPRRVSSARD